LQACEAETLLIAAFLGFGSLTDTAALIAKVCFVHRVIPQKRLPAALRYQEVRDHARDSPDQNCQ
jgi:hypothetical protein